MVMDKAKHDKIMAKRRDDPKFDVPDSVVTKIAAQANGAKPMDVKPESLDPNAKRNFKSLCIHFNEWEWNKLVEGVQKTRLSKNSFIREAIVKMNAETKRLF